MVRKVPIGTLGRVLGVIIGVVLGYYLNREINKTESLRKQVFAYKEGGGILSQGDLLAIVISVLVFWFGRRVHVLVRYIGLGMLGITVGEELYEAVSGEVSM